MDIRNDLEKALAEARSLRDASEEIDRRLARLEQQQPAIAEMRKGLGGAADPEDSEIVETLSMLSPDTLEKALVLSRASRKALQ